MKKIHINEPLICKILKFFTRIYIYLFVGFRSKSTYKPQKDEKIVVLSNHQTDLDPVFIRLSINRYMYILATDNIFSHPIFKHVLSYVGAIPKRKGVADFESIKKILGISKNGGSILIFPEGNRTYADFQFFIADNFASLLYKLKSTIVLYNIHGGFGTRPRFAHKKRKGKIYGEVKRVLKYDEYKDMSVEELNKIIKEELLVLDGHHNDKYVSKEKAEYLEKMFYVCPKCEKENTLISNKNTIRCTSCGLEVSYNEDLTLSSVDPSFKYHRLVDWYDYQRSHVKNTAYNNEIIYTDLNVSLDIVNPFINKKHVSKGTLLLTKKYLYVGEYKIDVNDIISASPMSGSKLCLSTSDNNYQIIGDKRFNALKYVFMFHKLDTKMSRENNDNYYTID